MKKYMLEWSILILQLLLFYLLPFFAGPTDAMGMVLLIILGTFLLALIMGAFSGFRWKIFWGVCAAVRFIPSMYLHYNETAWVHTSWYLVIATVGLLIGCFLRKMFVKG